MNENAETPTADATPETRVAPYNLSQGQSVELMLRTLVKNAILCNQGKDGPDVSNLQRGIQLIDHEDVEYHASAKRFEVVDAVAARVPQEPWLKRSLRSLFGTKAEHPALESEIAWIKEHGDQSSFTMLATQADMEMAAGRPEEAKETYRRALQAAREGGYIVTE